jgi:hypothetical protein
VGFLFYIQTGLFIEQPIPPLSSQTVADTSQPKSPPEQPKKSTLDTQDSVKVPSVETPKPSKETKQSPPAAETCDQTAAAAARRKYGLAAAAENDLHNLVMQKISRLSKILSSLGLAKDQGKAEITRHVEAIARIEETYKQALAASNCQS